jgi:hypothetical protein
MVLAEGWQLSSPPNPTFVDVPTAHPFYSYIETAYERGIISGYGCRAEYLELRPGASSTCGQICKIVYSAVAQVGKTSR